MGGFYMRIGGGGLCFRTILSRGLGSSSRGVGLTRGGEVKSISFCGGGGLAMPEIMRALSRASMRRPLVCGDLRFA